MDYQSKMKDLEARLAEISNINAATGLLFWDQATYMPEGAADNRSAEISTLTEISQKKFIDPIIGNLLDDLEPHVESLPFDSYEASLIRVTRRAFDLATRLPPEFIGRLTSHMSESFNMWAKARPENDFASMQPQLEKTLDLSREYADYFPGYNHIADPLIDRSDYGMKAETIRSLFDGLREELVPVVRQISEQPALDDACLHQEFDIPQQKELGEKILADLGYDFKRGRLDKTYHPFMIGFSLGDIRITTRYKKGFLGESLFSTMHECGHALYELGISRDLDKTPLADGISSGIHESQSRMWENIVGRSYGFWENWYPKLQAIFPKQFGEISIDEFYRAINKVQKSLIRTDADEITYDLHVMIRFGLELDLLEGKLEVKDLPEAWNERYFSDLGITPPDNKDGVLQDMHWYYGVVGGQFQGYTLGNILASQFYETALDQHPEIPERIKQGDNTVLHSWLIENIYKPGKKFTASEMVERVTGGPIRIDSYVKYLKKKFGDLYGITI